MDNRALVLLISFFALGIGSLIAFDLYSTHQSGKALEAIGQECSVCTLRHRSITRNRKFLEDMRRNAD
jgi:predicted hydrocarbon binding protein